MDALIVLLRIVLAAVFAIAAAGKLLDRAGSRQALAGFGVRPRLIGPVVVALPAAEAAVAGMLLFAGTAVPAGVGALVLLAVFSAGIARAMHNGDAPDCHCFGQLHSEPAGPRALVRNGVLAAISAVVVAGGPGPQITSWLARRTPAELVLLVALAAATASLLVIARRRLVEKALREAARPPGLPVGAVAPDFTLPRLAGGTVSLGDLRAPGRPILLVFTHPSCGPCEILLPDLHRWQRSLAGGVTIALVAQGPEAANRDVHDTAAGPVLLDEGGGVFKAYLMRSTPGAVALAADGRVMTATAEGDLPIEELLRVVLRRSQAIDAPQPADRLARVG